MQTFRRRNKQIKEFSGHNEASEGLRNRIVNCVTKYIGKPNPYSYGLDTFHGIYSSSLNEELNKEYGSRSSNYHEYLISGEAEDVFTVVEFIIQLGHKQLYNQDFISMIKELVDAFKISGSVYEISEEGLIVLKLNEQIQKEVDSTVSLLNGFEEAKKMYQDAVHDLVNRTNPLEVVKEAYLALEIYVKAKTGEKGKGAFDIGIKKLLDKKPIQYKIASTLKGFKGNAKGISHDGSYIIDEPDALWYLRSIGALFSLLESKIDD